jgi:hypothetical protein
MSNHASGKFAATGAGSWARRQKKRGLEADMAAKQGFSILATNTKA